MKHIFLAAPETRISEGVNFACFVWWSLLLLLPAHLFASQPSFRELALRGNEYHWGAWTLAATIIVLAGLATRRPLWRVLGMASAAGLWLFVAGLLAEGAQGLPLLGFLLPRNTGVGVYGSLAGASMVCAFRLAPYLIADLIVLIGFTLAARK